MVTFIINDREFTLEDSNTMLEAKKNIISELNLSCKYIDIEFCLERPMRTEGKFNIEPGKASRTFDRYTLNQFAFKDKVIVNIFEINDYDPDKKIALFSGGRGRGRGRGLDTSRPLNPTQPKFNTNLNQVEIETEINSFNLDSQDDFPSLGS
tara:strand:- start:152 stop:607 length:456 start_codon:yes stop_codon:yes gene_type:complete